MISNLITYVKDIVWKGNKGVVGSYQATKCCKRVKMVDNLIRKTKVV